ncbi:unnamed protein product [Haemonchus placei]|uniref:AN1-type domain-containing protein n=1 Tax=Haemonchus placei TaxID=6290 RepID=A0A3P7TI64_HAEPC|nr:unnamed protein product [Haemonchus placei]
MHPTFLALWGTDNTPKSQEGQVQAKPISNVFMGRDSFRCRRKLKLSEQEIRCMCNFTFCKRHREPSAHNCVIDYKGCGRSKITKVDIAKCKCHLQGSGELTAPVAGESESEGRKDPESANLKLKADENKNQKKLAGYQNWNSIG